ncbi:hypothetical protein G5714_023042 [Onychostoma macrolepis]|uniref:Uncharacterized protein n=1 Tax=Onychostoma macrolepis TaxID=369639 RepID=A0A7J6BRI2_9TELE|nr:hypothetical protein G5714_023042 [Onychostoma macrolepis]
MTHDAPRALTAQYKLSKIQEKQFQTFTAPAMPVLICCQSHAKRMLFGSGLTLLLCSIFAHIGSQSCRCKALPSRGLRMNCISQGLRTIPHLPAEITKLLLQNNLLTTVTPGHLDRLQHLQLVNLSGNPSTATAASST